MEATSFGANRTGAKMSPLDTGTMAAAADEASPEVLILTPVMDAAKVAYAMEADAIGSVPPPLSLKGVAKAGMAALKGAAPSVFVDKLGERLAFERFAMKNSRIFRCSATACSAWAAIPRP
jgi:hypothetical protein